MKFYIILEGYRATDEVASFKEAASLAHVIAYLDDFFFHHYEHGFVSKWAIQRRYP